MKKIFQLNSALNLFNALIALIFLVLPFAVIIFNTALENKKQFITSARTLGLSNDSAIYKVLIPKIKKTIFAVGILIIGRVFSESIMLSILLNSQNYSSLYSSNFLSSSLTTISPLISDNFLSDGGRVTIHNLMFFFGGLLLIITVWLNSFLASWVNKDWNGPFKLKCNIWLLKFQWFFYSRFVGSSRDFHKGLIPVSEYVFSSLESVDSSKSYSSKKISQFLSFSIVSIFAVVFISCLVFLGLKSGYDSHFSIFSMFDTDLYRAFLNTLLVIILTISPSLVISIMITFYLSEYASNKKLGKYTLTLMNASSSTPSIIYGIFGLAFFIHNLGWTSAGSSGKSLYVGIIIMNMLIVPFLTKLFYTYSSEVSRNYKTASYALGMSKFSTFFGIIFPLIYMKVIDAIFLSVGKIVGETAPLFLTAGASNIRGDTIINYPGQTLTTRIYSCIHTNNLSDQSNQMWSASLCCIALISFIILLGKLCTNLIKFWNERFREVSIWKGLKANLLII